jgi:5-methyltetrahydrofolate--homocysteine methyltransferase
MTVAEMERWLAPILNYIPAQERPTASRAATEVVQTRAPAAMPANDISAHPPGCTCAAHLAWRKKAVGAG